ncbi:MAG: hypothetical protein AAF580_03020 [Pseudomonadota bacterium]
MRALLIPAAGIVLVIVALANFSHLASTAPSFNSAVRDTQFIDDWREGATMVLLNGSAYNRIRALRHLANVKGPADMPLVRRASELAATAVNAAPGDPYSWSLLAWSQMLRTDNEAALIALDRSWALGPVAAPLASDRVLLAAGLGLYVPGAATPERLVHLQRDARMLISMNPQQAAFIGTQYPDLARFMVRELKSS